MHYLSIFSKEYYYAFKALYEIIRNTMLYYFFVFYCNQNCFSFQLFIVSSVTLLLSNLFMIKTLKAMTTKVIA